LKLEVKSQSPVLDSYHPDFSIQPNSQGYEVIRRLLSFVPDVVFIEGSKAFVENPTAGDSSSYSYGLDHPILEGRYRREAWETNRIQVEGYDPAAEEAVIVDTFSWSEIGRLYDKLERLEDLNIASVAQAGERGEAYLRHAEMASVSGVVRIPPNCGQQLYDVIDITDLRAGLSSARRRVIGITLIYRPLRGEYEERLLLGAV
ncbi:MAG: hypothetical protein P8X92_07915, partial [Dehalococcoidia bacterium]